MPRHNAASQPRDARRALEDVSFTYTDGERPALSGVSRFEVAAGEMIGVMGASGAGKSTLAKCLNRIVPSSRAATSRAWCESAAVRSKATRVCEVAPRVGMVFQDFEAQLFSTNVAHEVAFAMEQVGMEREEMVRRIGPRSRRSASPASSIATRPRSPAAKSSGWRLPPCSRCGPR